MADKKETRTRTRLFVSTIVIAGGAALARSLYELYSNPISNEWMLLAALTLLSFFFTVKVPGIPAKISVSETFVFTSVLLFGTAATTDCPRCTNHVWLAASARAFEVLLNATEPALSIFIASHLFFLIVKEPLSK